MLKTVESLPLLGTQNAEYSQTMWTHTIGKRSYELQNHLGNVLSVISDKPLPHNDDSDGTVDWYLADIKQSTDYSPFGVQLSGRNLMNSMVSKDFRYGFQGYEGDSEVKGHGNSYTTEFRQYDPRLGRWLTTDPLLSKYPNVSPYVAFANNPILIIDNNGDSVARFGYFSGEFLGFFDDGKDGWSFDIGYYNADNNDLWLSKKHGYFNDPTVDIQAIKNGAIKYMEVMSDEKVEKLIKASGVKTTSLDGLIYAAKERSDKMDYGYRGMESGDLFKYKFYMRDGIAYNIADIGNYLFGRGAQELGLLFSEIQIGSNLNNMIFGRRQNDSKNSPYNFGPGTYGPAGFFNSQADQNAINRGYRSTKEGAERYRKEMETIVIEVEKWDKSRSTVY